MLLRSSSTPVLGSLISAIAESPNNNHGDNLNIIKHQSGAVHHGLSRFSINSLHVTSVSCNSSPAVSEFSNSDSHRGFRRAQSEGNLEGLVKAASSGYDDLYNCGTGLRREGRSRCSLLETIPSFSAFNLRDGFEDWAEEEIDPEDEILEDDEEFEEWSCGDEVKSEAAVEGSQKCNGVIYGIEYMGNAQETQDIPKRMYPAVGVGVDGGGGNDSGRGGGGGSRGDMTPGNGENGKMEEYYKDMVEKNPGNSLILRNYAHFLYQVSPFPSDLFHMWEWLTVGFAGQWKQDLEGAEEYFSRAILADPSDGEILAEYARLIWELHHDRERALSYFRRAVEGASEGSHVHAAYASFLWETEEDSEEPEEGASPNEFEFFHQFHSTMTSATA